MVVKKFIERAAIAGTFIFLGETIQMRKCRKAYEKDGIKGLIMSVLDSDEILNDENVTIEFKK